MSGQNNSQPPGGAPASVPSSANLSQMLSGLTMGPASNTQAGGQFVVPSVPLQDSPDIVWDIPDRSVQPPPKNSYTAGNPSNSGNGVVSQLKPLRNTMDYPIRDSLRINEGTNQGKGVITNHFEVVVDHSVKFYRYCVTGISESERRGTRRRYIETAIQNVPFLRNNRSHFATDNINTIISWKDLHSLAPGPKIGAYNANIRDSADDWRLIDVIDRNVTSYLNLRLVGTVDFAEFQRYISSSHNNPVAYNPEPTRRALHIIISKCIHNPGNIFHLNANKFFVTHAFNDLWAWGDQVSTFRAIRGYEYKIKPGMGKILLNVNPVTSAFWYPHYLCDVMWGGLNAVGGDILTLKGVMVYIWYDRGKGKKPKDSGINAQHSRVKKIRGFGEALNVQTFKLDIKDQNGNVTGTRRMTVADYLEQTYNRTLAYKVMLAVDLGTGDEPSWFAPEDLQIVPYQIWARVIPDAVANDFHRIACKTPGNTRSCTELEGLAELPRNLTGLSTNTNTHANAQLAPLTQCPAVKLNPTMLQIPAVQLPFATVRYNDSIARWQPASGRWNLAGNKFLKGPARSVKWKLICGQRVSQQAAQHFTTHFDHQLVATGVCPVGSVTHIGQTLWIPGGGQSAETKLNNILFTIHDDKTLDQSATPHIVVLLIEKRDQELYSSFKYLADTVYYFQAICATEQNFRHKRDGWTNSNHMRQYMANVAMKANLKFAGINHTADGVSNWLDKTLVIGSDLTHPGNGAVDQCPSIAAVVSSVGKNGGLFYGRLWLQRKSDMIQNFQAAVFWALQQWRKKNHRWPENILYYRDGVSESQYEELQRDEVSLIQAAWDDLAEIATNKPASNLKLTTVIATKRHSTRFFPTKRENAMQNNENCKPGTLVDSVVTNPYFSDFFLQSHNAIKGTARPCHYFVLNNGMGISMSALEDLTHSLSHTYVRATMGVSYAPPAYYADRLCERGRSYLRKYYNPDRATKNDFDERKRKIQTQVREDRKAENKRLGRPEREKGHKKTDKEIKEDEEDREKVDAALKNALMDEIVARFNGNPVDDRAKRRMESHGKTMYWM